MLKEVDFRHYIDKARRMRDKTQATRVTYLRILKDYPREDEEINYELAKYLRDEKYYKEAEFRYKKASIIMPRDISVYNGWGILLDRQGKLEGQEELYRKVLEIEPNSSEGLCNLGAVFTEKCKFEDAIVVFEKALSLRPNHTNVVNNLASVYLILGRYDKTIEKLEKALEMQRNHVNAHINLGLVSSCLGKDDEAKENYQIALDLIGNNSDQKAATLRGCKRLFNFARGNLVKEKDDEEKRNHNERFSKALAEFISLLE